MHNHLYAICPDLEHFINPERREHSEAQKKLKLYTETVARWIISCSSEEQIPICREAITNLVTLQFEPLVKKGNITKADLLTAESILFTLADRWARWHRFNSGEVNWKGRNDLNA